MYESQTINDTAPAEHAPEAVISLMKSGAISREEARKQLGLFDEAQLLCHR